MGSIVLSRDLSLVLRQCLVCVAVLLLGVSTAPSFAWASPTETCSLPTLTFSDTTGTVIVIAGPDTVCARNLPVTYLASPVGGNFIFPKGLPPGLVTVKDNQFTLNPGFDIINTSVSYQVDEPSGELASISVKYLTIVSPPNPTITKPMTICAGNYANLVVENCPGKVIWNTGVQYFVTTVNPTITTEYSARCITNGCDTTLRTKVTVDGIYPDVKIIGTTCSEDRKTYEFSFDAAENVTITSNLGILQDNKIADIPASKTFNVTFRVGTCSSTFNLTGSPCAADPNCSKNLSTIIAASAATCSDSGARSDASIVLGFPNLADRYTYAGTAAGLATYENAVVLTGKKITISNLPNPIAPTGKTYYFRFYRGSAACSFDTTVVVPYRDCSIPCAKPDAGSDYFVSRHHNEIKLPDANTSQKWVVSSDIPLGDKNPTIINPSTGQVYGLFPNGKYAFVLMDGGSGSLCSDTAFVFVGNNDLPILSTYSDTITLPKYILNTGPGATYAEWNSTFGNSATLTSSGRVSGLTSPGSYSFRIFNPYNPGNEFLTNDVLTLTVIKLAKPDDCPPGQCIPFSIKRVKLAAK